MRILKDKTIGVVVDIQEKLFPHINENEKILENCIKLINGLKILEIPLIVTEQYTKGLGNTILQIKEVLGESYQPIEKMDFSCCGISGFMSKINSGENPFVILMGIESHVCVLQTALDLLENGFIPVVVQDCISSRKPNDKKIAIKRMLTEGCIITTYESILLELCKIAGTDKFKAISKIIR